MTSETAIPRTRLVELPGRGTTRVWECAGPRGAQTLVLIHGVTFTVELNWAKIFAPLGRHFRVAAADLRGHGDGIRAGSRFRLEDCADDVAALAGVLGIGRFAAVGYSMGGIVAQLLYRRHAALVSGLVLCSTARDVRGSPAEQLAALAAPPVAAALWWNRSCIWSAPRFSARRCWATSTTRQQAAGPAPSCGGPPWPPQSRPSGSSASSPRPPGSARPMSPLPWWSWPATVSCRRAASSSWPGDPGRIGARGGRRSRGMHHRAAFVRTRPAPGMLVGGGRPRRHAARAGLTRPTRDPAAPRNRPGAGPP